MRQEFLEFLSGLEAGHCTSESWQRFVVTHYREAELEEARVELVRVSMAVG